MFNKILVHPVLRKEYTFELIQATIALMTCAGYLGWFYLAPYIGTAFLFQLGG
jgi:hypothetical protein